MRPTRPSRGWNEAASEARARRTRRGGARAGDDVSAYFEPARASPRPASAAAAVDHTRRVIALAGPRGAGKTTVGRLVAATLGRAFVDLDDEVERLAGAPVREVFAREGEAGFRALEGRALAAALDAAPDAVLALGGGTLTVGAARDLLRARARVVYLAAPAEVLAARVAADPRTADGRPSLRPGGPLAEARALLREREATDRAAADVVVDATGPPDEVAAAVVRAAAPLG